MRRPGGGGHRGLLDDHVEAHVHGGVELGTDVEALALDPAFRGTAVEDEARALGLPVRWHEGRRLHLSELERHPGFRGPRVVALGARVAERGVVDAAVVARTAGRGGEDPQELERLWHCVARYGVPTLVPGAAES